VTVTSDGEPVADEPARVARLLDAQHKAAELFTRVEELALVVPGITERQASDMIRDLASDLFGVKRHWHKRIVRAGPNTLHPYMANPPDRVIAEDDIVFCDFGPIFEEWEADFGRTFVFGHDPVKHRLREDLSVIWQAGRDHFDRTAGITGAELFAAMVALAERAGWEFGGPIAGHLIGQFPHDGISDDEMDCYIAPGSDLPMRRTDRTGQQCHWILEVHLISRDREIGGFHEELLDVPSPATRGASVVGRRY
jgi:Xaa-Pro aminopeptidase